MIIQGIIFAAPGFYINLFHMQLHNNSLGLQKLTMQVQVTPNYIFKPDACRPAASTHLVSYNCFCPWMSVCVYVCVSAPEAMNN